MRRNHAEMLALKALDWLLGRDDLLPVFLGASGASLGDLRGRVEDPALLAAVLDFVTMDDEWVSEFCEATSVPYDAPMQARAALPGGELPHWT